MAVFRVRHYHKPLRMSEAQFDDIPLLPAPIPKSCNNHYKSLSDILKDDPTGTPNTAHQPTLIDRENINAVKLASKKGDSPRCTIEGVKAIAGTVRAAIKCSECDKPRLIYSKDFIETNELLPLLGFDYTCGGSFLPDSHPKATVVGTLANLECWKPISTAYYSTYKALSNRNVELMRFAKLCYICGIAGDTVEERQPLTSSSSVFSFISPTCLECHQKGYSRYRVKVTYKQRRGNAPFKKNVRVDGPEPGEEGEFEAEDGDVNNVYTSLSSLIGFPRWKRLNGKPETDTSDIQICKLCFIYLKVFIA